MMQRHIQILGLTLMAVLTLSYDARGESPSSPPAKKPPVPGASHQAPEIGAISRSTGHLFREGLASGISADGNTLKSPLIPNKNGVLIDEATGSLGPKLWEGLSKDDLQSMLSHLAPVPGVPVVQDLARRLLLTDAPWPGETDLLALRLEKMVAFGRAIDAAHLYAHMSPDDPDADLLSVGIPALLYSGDLSTACLEVQTNASTWSTPKIWADMTPKALCASDHTSPTPTSSAEQSLANLLPPSLLALTAHDASKIDWSTIKDWNGIESFPFLYAEHLILDPTTPPGLRLKLYNAFPASAVPKTPPAVGATFSPSPKDDAHWDLLAAAYFDQIAATPKPGTESRARKILPHLKGVSLQTQMLFTPTFMALSPTIQLPDSDLRRVTALILATNPVAADPWIRHLRAQLPVKMTHDPGGAALLLLGQTRGLPGAKGPIPLEFSTFSSQGDINLGAIFKNLSDLLDTAPDFIDNPPVVYEKKNDLTSADHYVMPMSVLRTNLVDGAKNGQVGRVILASLLAVQTADPKMIDADLLADILKSMVAVGLNEEARQIATYVFLGVTLTGE